MLHARWSHKADGFFELWQDDKLVTKDKGPNCYNDKLNPCFKIGVYKWDLDKSAIKGRVLYIDEVRIGNDKATYQDVYPSNNLTKTTKVRKGRPVRKRH